MSEIASALGLPVQWVSGKRTCAVAPCTFEIEGLFEVWVEEQALLAIQRHQQTLGPAGVALQMDGWRRECAAQVYCWDGVECWTARVSLPGRKRLAALQLAKGNEGLGMAAATDLVEEAFDGEATRRELEATVARANADPNRERPWRRATAGGSAS